MSVMVIAEAGVNHDGKWERALDLVDIAKEAKADAVKFQIFNADTCNGPYREILKPLKLNYAQFTAIKAHCDDVGIRFMASCFDCAAVDFVADLGCDTVKIGSGEITNYRLLDHARLSGLHVILSTGMSTPEDVCAAVNALDEYTLLHCVSLYPTPRELCNLKAITTLKQTFRRRVGLSDHTLGRFAAVMAVALGAEVIEKHFTHDKGASGPDHSMSLSPQDIGAYVQAIRLSESMLGTGVKALQPGEAEMQKIARGRWCTAS